MRSYDQYCALALALDVVGDRWTLLIVRELLTGAKRFRDLQDGLPGIATNLLSSRLRMMEEHGLVQKAVLPPPAGSSTYRLTSDGEELAAPVHALVRWGGRFMRRRARTQAFRPQWLGVALQALGVRSDSPAPIALEIELPEGLLQLEITREGVGFPAVGTRRADVRLRGAATTVLGLAAGELNWPAAVLDGLEAEGSKAAVATVRASLTRASLANSRGHRETRAGEK
jgi:DNA-binding HxlR family transcriptional regulator